MTIPKQFCKGCNARLRDGYSVERCFSREDEPCLLKKYNLDEASQKRGNRTGNDFMFTYLTEKGVSHASKENLKDD